MFPSFPSLSLVSNLSLPFLLFVALFSSLFSYDFGLTFFSFMPWFLSSLFLCDLGRVFLFFPSLCGCLLLVWFSFVCFYLLCLLLWLLFLIVCDFHGLSLSSFSSSLFGSFLSLISGCSSVFLSSFLKAAYYVHFFLVCVLSAVHFSWHSCLLAFYSVPSLCCFLLVCPCKAFIWCFLLFKTRIFRALLPSLRGVQKQGPLSCPLGLDTYLWSWYCRPFLSPHILLKSSTQCPDSLLSLVNSAKLSTYSLT